ncbi:rhodanese-like domain-containing protein [Hymenobacter profundi]|uniref:Rhodanese-like domain-containing protein n=1 Tax=Hymenobacter profundi TaxID=1982110 RepID=A0ABS6WU82_9BACT|nr:rhodanese-like domain-containing protein [Hymenobacter profundi]MBW3127132.1 rhodanese-like domain-containing protein [Hymenobacter profundi]
MVPQLTCRLGLSLLLLGTAACRGQAQQAPPTTSPLYSTMLQGLLKQSVPFVSVAQLRQQPPAVLLDTRAPAEFAVSHLRGARWVGYEEFQLARVQDLPKNTPIVVYCSVGYRSEKIGEQLQQAGYTHVRNLYGGLFEWVNEGQPAVTAGNAPTARVHAFSRSWGIWLQRGQKVYE